MARTILLIYGLINIAGGIIGYVAAKSDKSLIAGCLAGAVLLMLYAMVPKNPGMAFRVSGVVCLALAGFWAYRLNEVASANGKTMMPMMNLVLAIGVFAALIMLHFKAQKARASS